VKLSWKLQIVSTAINKEGVTYTHLRWCSPGTLLTFTGTRTCTVVPTISFD